MPLIDRNVKYNQPHRIEDELGEVAIAIFDGLKSFYNLKK